MPHIKLEHSSNIQPQPDDRVLFRQLHQVLNETGGINLGNCKSRRYVADNFYIADGDAKHGFVHLDIRFIEGRAMQVKQEIADQCNTILQTAFATHIKIMDVQITVEVRDIKLANYNKFPVGTLTKDKPEYS